MRIFARRKRHTNMLTGIKTSANLARHEKAALHRYTPSVFMNIPLLRDILLYTRRRRENVARLMQKC